MILENLYLIVAITEKTNAIGKDNNLLYFLKEDMNFFKEKTCGNSIICGRKTFEGFKIKPLPKRKNIVLTKSDFSFEGVRRFKNIEDLINFVKENPKEKFFVCGGMSIYEQLIDFCSRMYITKYEEKEAVEADSHFPKIDEKVWKVVEKIDAIAAAASDEDHEYTEPDYQWFDRWRENAEHASTEDLQILWAKVLCTECKNNKSISLRTLEVLKNLNHDEAEKIELIAALNASGLIIRVIGNPLIDSDQVILPKDIPLTYFIDLEELGIISGVNELGVSYALKDFGAENESTFLIGLPKHSLHIHSNKKIEKLPINGFKITKIGNEIMQILDVDTNKQYLTNLVSVLNSKNYETYVV